MLKQPFKLDIPDIPDFGVGPTKMTGVALTFNEKEETQRWNSTETKSTATTTATQNTDPSLHKSAQR